MSNPQLRTVDNQQPRNITHQPEWRSDAERDKLPVVNVIDTGAPLLDRDAVLGYEDHDRRLGRK